MGQVAETPAVYLSVTPTLLLAALRDPAFYDALPVGCAVTADDGKYAIQAAREWALTADPLDRATPPLARVLISVLVPLRLAIQAAQSVAADGTLEPLRAYLRAKFGVSATRFVLYGENNARAVF